MTTTELGARIERLVVDEYFRDPPRFVVAMATEPTRAVAGAFVLEWTKFSRLFPRWVGAIMASCPESDVLAFEVENLMSEVLRDPAGSANHYDLLLRLGAALGMGRGRIEAHESCAEACAAFEHWWTLARHPDWLLGFTAVNGLEILGDRTLPARHGLAPITGLEADPWARLGVPDDALEFFRVSSEADVGHGAETVHLIARHTPDERAGEVLGVLSQSIARLRVMMAGLWSVAQGLDGADAVTSSTREWDDLDE
jgi:pyrroloquinoline quinone (PQQ) biosynthesis protein C